MSTGPTPDTADLRSGIPIHEALLALLPLVGTWLGTGVGIAPSGAPFSYGQRISVVHDGRAFLAYESRSWLLDAEGAVLRQAWRETGFWRPGAGADDIEVVLASNTGEALVYAGTAEDQRWDIASRSSAATPTATAVDAERRLYAIVSGELVYATEVAPSGRPAAPHLNARLAHC